MREIKFTDLITKSVDRTSLMLFKPFSARKWLKLLLIAFLAGALPGGCGSGGGGKHSDKKAEAAPSVVQTQTQVVTNEIVPAASEKAKQSKDKADEIIDALAVKVMSLPPTVTAVVIFGAVALFLGVMVLLAWISARFRFVWFDAVVRNRDAIAEPFHGYKKEGDSIFKVWLAVGGGFLVFIGILVVWVMVTLTSVSFFKDSSAVSGGAIVSLIFAFLIFIAAIIAVSIWSVAVDHFVTSIMAIDRITFRPAWQKFWGIYRANTKDMWLYVLALIGLGIVVSIAEGVILFLILIAFFLAGLIVFGLLYFIFALIKAKMLFWIVALILGIPAGIVALAVLAGVGLPFAVFFRNFSLYYLSSLQCGYAPLELSHPKENV